MGLAPSSRYAFLTGSAGGAFYSRGRYALLEAYRLAGVGPGRALLAPAYHCRTMVDPAVRLAAETVLYPCDRELRPDWPSISRLIETSVRPVKALLLTHFFGIRQDMKAARAFCDAHDLALIEDCSHAFAYLQKGEKPGTYSDFVIASPYKFAPCEDGGLLLAGRGGCLPDTALRSPGPAAQLRALARTVERVFSPPPPPAATASAAPIRPAELVPAAEAEEAGDTLSTLYDPRDENNAGFFASRLILGTSNPDKIAEARRSNYRRWVEAVAPLPRCQALFPELEENCVPYMFPLYIDHPNPHFYILKHLGVPIWRWDEMAVSACPVAADYRLRVLHLPCHQALGAGEMAWLTATVAEVMRTASCEPCR